MALLKNTQPKAQTAKIYGLVSSLVSRAQLAWRAGISFGGARDYYKVFGYKSALTFDDYLAKFVRQDIAARIVNAPIQGTWRNPPEVTGNAAFNTAWAELTAHGVLWANVEKLDRLASLGQYGVGLMGFDDGSTLEAPVAEDPDRELTFFQPLSQKSALVKRWEDDPKEPRFGRPKFYAVTLGGMTTDGSQQTMPERQFTVHWSRCLHIAPDSIQNPSMGTPILEKVYNLLDDVLKVTGGSAETYWLTANRGLHVDVDKEMKLLKDDADKLSDEIDEYVNQLTRVIKTRGVEVNSLGSDVPNPSGTFGVLISLISGATGIPQRILLGSEAGQLASEQDRANWADRIEERRTSYAEPFMLTPMIERFQMVGVLPQSEWNVVWPEAFIMSPLERAQMMAQQARAVINLSKRNQMEDPIITDEEARVIIGLPEKGAPESKLGFGSTATEPPSGAPGSSGPSAEEEEAADSRADSRADQG